MRKFFTYDDPILPVHHPRLVVETATSQGAVRNALLERGGLTEAMLASPDARISYRQFGMLTGAALRLTRNPALGLDAGRNMQLPSLGILGLAIMSSPTVGGALHVLLRHYRTIAPALDLRCKIEGGLVTLTIRESMPLEPFHAFAMEMVLFGSEVQARSLAGRSVPVRKLRLDYPAPPHAARYAELTDGPVLFEQDATEVEFDASFLETKVAGADPATAKLAEQYCAQLVQPAQCSNGLLSQVRRILGASRGRPPDAESLARELQTSERTLSRFLRKMGTSYQELLEEAQRARAEEWVRSTDATLDQVAEQLGFSDARSFRRAFKRWTGHTPSEFRAAAHP